MFPVKVTVPVLWMKGKSTNLSFGANVDETMLKSPLLIMYPLSLIVHSLNVNSPLLMYL